MPPPSDSAGLFIPARLPVRAPVSKTTATAKTALISQRKNWKAKKKYNVPTLEFQIRALHDELNIAKHVDEIAAASPGVPRGIIEQMALARARGPFCVCEAYRITQGGN